MMFKEGCNTAVLKHVVGGTTSGRITSGMAGVRQEHPSQQRCLQMTF